MTPYLIATALVSLAIGFSFAAHLYSRVVDTWKTIVETWKGNCEKLSERNRAQRDAFNHILNQRNELQNKLNELTK